MARDERGYIVVETIGAFLPLVLMMLSILSLVNIVAVQARMHYALTQAAQTVSMYGYVLDVTGAARYITENAGQAEKVQGEIDTARENIGQVLSGIESLSPEEVVQGGQNLWAQAEDLAAMEPKQIVQDLLNYGLNRAGNAAFSTMMRPLVGHYLGNGRLSGDEYLRQAQVIDGLQGLTFTAGPTSAIKGSTLMDSQGFLWLNVVYDVDYTFGALPLPFSEPKLSITQTVVTKVWLNGSGEGYKP